MKEFRFQTNKTNKKNQMKTLNLFVSLLVKELELTGRHGTARAYRSSLKRLQEFAGDLDVRFTDLNPAFLKQYESYLCTQNCKRNTISLYMRMLRSICNQARYRGVAKIAGDLFDEVFTGTDTSAKRAVSPSVIRRLIELEIGGNRALETARDMFLLSFYLRGIPFVDLIHLRKTDLDGSILRYRRSKTGRLLTVTVEPCAQEILHKYALRAKAGSFLLPIIINEGSSGYRQYQNALRRYNIHLNKLSGMLGIKVNLTSYVARHSWATAAYRRGIPVAVISESLGHASEKVTYTYLAAFDNNTLSKANQEILSLVLGDKSPYPGSLDMQKEINGLRFKLCE